MPCWIVPGRASHGRFASMAGRAMPPNSSRRTSALAWQPWWATTSTRACARQPRKGNSIAIHSADGKPRSPDIPRKTGRSDCRLERLDRRRRAPSASEECASGMMRTIPPSCIELVGGIHFVSPALRLHHLEDTRRAHAGADAHGHHAVFLLPAAHAVDEGRDTDGAGGAERMAERDRTALRVHLVGIETQVLDAREGLRGEGFVEFDPLHVVLPHAGGFQCFGNRFLGAYAHDFGRHAGDRKPDEACERGQAVILDRLFAGQQPRAGAVRYLRGGAGGDRSITPEHGA